ATAVVRSHPDLVAIGVLWLLAALFHAPLFLPPLLRRYVVSGDFTNQFYPFRHFATSEWWQGRVPLWNPYVFAGHPFLADVQTAVFYPVTWVTVLLNGPGNLRFILLELEMALHFGLAATFAYLFGRELYGRRVPAVLAALVFTFSGFLTSYPVQQLAMLETAVWLPLSLYFLERGAPRPPVAPSPRRPFASFARFVPFVVQTPAPSPAVPELGPVRRHGEEGPVTASPRLGSPCLRTVSAAWQYAALAGAANGLGLLAGHPQTSLFAGYLAVVYLVYRYWRFGVRALLLAVVIFATASVGLAAVAVVPAVEFLPLSTRAQLDFAAAGHGYAPTSLLGALIPLWREEKALSIGIVGLVLAGLAIWRDRRPAVRFWAGVGLFSFLLSVGSSTPLYWLLYEFAPGFRLFRDQERVMYLWSLAGAVLAGYGWLALTRDGAKGAVNGFQERIERISPSAIRSIRSPNPLTAPFAVGRGLLIGAGGGLLAAGVVWLGEGGQTAGSAWSAARAALASAGVLLPLALLLVRWGRWPVGHRTSAVTMALLLAVDLWSINYGNNQAAVDPDPVPRLGATAAFIRSSIDEPFRIRPASDSVFPPNDAMLLGLPTINGDTPFQLARQAELLARPEADYRLWQLLNVKYVLFEPERPAMPGIEPIAQQPNHVIYRMQYSLPRAWAVRRHQVASSSAEARAMVLAPEFHPGDVVILEEPPRGPAVVPGPRPDVRIERLEPRRVEIAADADAPAFLVLADSFYPGWVATVDGSTVPIYRANYLTRAIELPPGQHRVVFAYRPASFLVGVAISAVTLLALATLLWSHCSSRCANLLTTPTAGAGHPPMVPL
ncbi:MAG: YfhO family protein, partial [Chloroflexi bacterium]|nr:YfhO family protein [Chloroflexota bacterium]